MVLCCDARSMRSKRKEGQGGNGRRRQVAAAGQSNTPRCFAAHHRAHTREMKLASPLSRRKNTLSPDSPELPLHVSG